MTWQRGGTGDGCISGTWRSDALVQTLDLGEAGLVPLEVRWLHDPDSEQGFVGAALASNICASTAPTARCSAEPVIEVENEELEGWPLPAACRG